jgi:hypothetical protein
MCVPSVVAISVWEANTLETAGMVRKATAEAFGRGASGMIEIVGPDGQPPSKSGGQQSGGCGGNSALDW